jgi:hypothetical protein
MFTGKRSSRASSIRDAAGPEGLGAALEQCQTMLVHYEDFRQKKAVRANTSVTLSLGTRSCLKSKASSAAIHYRCYSPIFNDRPKAPFMY